MQVFYTSPWIPAEWIRAHGLEPRGIWLGETFSNDSLPLAAGVCAFAEAAVRFAEARSDAAVIFATTCDQLRRGFDSLAAKGRARAFLFNFPATWQTSSAQRLFRSELKRLGRFLEGLGGTAPTAEALAQTLQQRRRLAQRLIEFGPRCSARQFAEAIARFHWDGSVQLPDPAPLANAQAVPLGIVGGPLLPSHWNLLDTLESEGARVVLNATETGERSLASVSPDQSSQPDYFCGCVDVFQRPNTRLYDWLGRSLQARGGRGLILWSWFACDLWRAEAASLREAFSLPVLSLEAGETPGVSPRERGRLQAFLEMLR
jgi:benzoyl-CoA reductase/2-hydroxyglutaryl-CoA dehydratase subunit BcrC/BadD/HgdB